MNPVDAGEEIILADEAEEGAEQDGTKEAVTDIREETEEGFEKDIENEADEPGTEEAVEDAEAVPEVVEES